MILPQKRRGVSGAGAYSLVEMVVVVALLGVLGAFLAVTLYTAAQGYIDVRSRSANVSDAHQAFELMSRELQEIRTATSTDISAFTASTLTFTDINAASVSYGFSGTTLTRNSQTLLDNLQSFSFAYKKTDGTAATLVTEIWSVEVNAVLLRSGRTLALRTRLFPRNFTAKLTTWKKT